MITKTGRRYVILAWLLVFGLAAHANAGIITSLSVSLPGSSTGTIGPVGATPSPNNDNATAASPNTIPFSIFFNTFGAAEFEFQVADSGGTTEYLLTQALINNTGQTWTDFHFELGFGTGASFVPSSPSSIDLLDFDTLNRDPAPTSTGFTVLDHQADTIDWSGGNIVAVSSVLFSLSIDVPDGLAALHPSGLNRFTLRQVPTAEAVPEPTAIVLITMGVAGLMARRRAADRFKSKWT